MAVTARNPLELIPIALAVVSAAVFFNLPTDLLGVLSDLNAWYAPAILSAILAITAIVFGYRFLKQNGRNAVVWVGVAGNILVLTFDFAYLLIFYIWQA
jgi:predicted membrane protein